MKKILLNRYKITHIPFLYYFKIKDTHKEYMFKTSYWSDGNISVTYKRKGTLHYYDLGFRGTVYGLEDLENNLINLNEVKDNETF